MIKIINYFLQSIFVYLFFFLGRILGLNIGRKFFANFFLLIGPFFKSSKTVQNNLNIVSYNLSPFNKKKITESMWKNYGMTFIEYVFLSSFRKKNSHIIIKKEENLKEIIEENEPVIFISGHFANFELMSMEISKKKIPLATIYRPLNNIFINPFMEYLRKKYVCRNQIKKGIKGVRETIEYIKKKHSIALMIDQRVSEGKRINFFNKPAFTTTLPAQLSIKFALNIVPVYIERTANNNFQIEFQKKINPKNFKNKIDLTEELNKIIEKMLMKNPNQWIWTHNRWK
tara:strand:+ start:4837 stop:5694 length:858 start_codon:yes stop_codon:yes gene_type:complete